MAVNNISDKQAGTQNGTSDERRRAKRFPFSGEIEALEPKSGAVILGRISDLGSGGCYVDTMSPFPLGTHLRIRIRKDKETFEAQAKVVHSQANMGMGLLFIAAEQDQVVLFKKWMLHLSGGEAPRQAASPAWSAREDATKKAGKAESDDALGELVTILMRKGVLTESEGTSVLRKLSH